MDETCPVPTPNEAPTPARTASGGRSSLRRFHFGDPEAAVGPLPPGLLPAALNGLRQVPVRGGWPLLIDPDPGAGTFARSFESWLAASTPEEGPVAEHRERLAQRVAERAGARGRPAPDALSEAAGELAAELGLGEDGVEELAAAVAGLAAGLTEGAILLGFDREAPLELARLAAERRQRAGRLRFAARSAELAGVAEALLEADRGRRPAQVPDQERVGRFGALGSRFVDPKRLAGVVEHRKAGQPLAEDRLQRLEQARSLLAKPLAGELEPLWLLPRGLPPRELGGSVRFVEDPCAAAARAFDRRAEETAPLVRAARLVALEGENLLDAERHLPWLERLDWRGFEPDELALVPAVFALVRRSDLVGGGLAALSRLLLSGRPVQVLVLDEEERRGSEGRLEPALLGMAHREAFVHQGSVARPEALAANLARALDSGRTGLHVIDLPVSGTGEIDPWLVAAARLSGRAAPSLVYDPETGRSWSRRLRLDGNPSLLTDWPAGPLALNGDSPAGAEGGEPFTFADAALLDPAWRGDFAIAGESEELLPLAEWLELAADEAVRRLPFVLAAGADGEPVRLVVTRALAAASRDRLAFWRNLEEVAGVRSERVDEAAESARSEADERAAAEREQLLRQQAEELENVRASADSAAAARIVQALISLGGGDPVAIGELAAPVAAPPAAVPVPATQAPAEPAAAAAAPGVARVDTALCTSCDECIRKFPAIFAYDANKQAYLKDPRGGSFRDLVLAAAACSARVIHPGAPWNPSEPDLDKWVERAKAYE